MRAVVDANVFVSAILTPTGPPGAVVRALAHSRFDLIVSEPIIEDVKAVLARPRITRKYRIPIEHIEGILRLMREQGELVPVTGAVRMCRDPDDDLVLETALVGGAEVLVSRDADVTRDPRLITALGENGVAVMTVQQFLDLLDVEISEPA